MTASLLVRTAVRASRVAAARPGVVALRAAAPVRAFSAEPPATTTADDDVVVPELVETLEWVLDSPPPIHQFEEPPIVVEIGGIEPAGKR